MKRATLEHVTTRRVFVAVAVGLTVAGTAYGVAYYEQRGHPNYLWEEEHTGYALDRIREAVTAHRRATGQFPAHLGDLEDVKAGGWGRTDADGRLLDLWGNPYQYRVEGDAVTVYSFGPDGRPGGDGRDADIHPKSTRVPRPPPTLRQFTFTMPTEGVRVTCILSGLCAALVCLLPARRLTGVAFLAAATGTAVGAVLVAVVLSYLHIPTGH
ncbi:type II secretion system protein GspG [bacterium]|nr:type II secretion system protein GspG [bacterium]